MAATYDFPDTVGLLLNAGASMPPNVQQPRSLLWTAYYSSSVRDVMRILLERASIEDVKMEGRGFFGLQWTKDDRTWWPFSGCMGLLWMNDLAASMYRCINQK